MSAREELRAKSAELVRRETVTLPESGVTVRVRGLTAGEAHRCGSEKGFKQQATQIALCTEDPSTGEAFWQAHVLEHVQEIEALHPVDAAFLTRKINELSGLGKLRAMLTNLSDSAEPNSSGSPSPE